MSLLLMVTIRQASIPPCHDCITADYLDVIKGISFKKVSLSFFA